MVSPVWLQILRKGKLKYEVGGTHDIDAGWVKDVRKYGRGKSKSNINKIKILIKFTNIQQMF